MKSADTVLMTLGRKGLTSGAIKGLTVCCFTMWPVCVLLCKHAISIVIQSSVLVLTGEIRIVYIQTSPLSV
ncbi:unnamed protein product, partial [Staurois parvus]